MSRTSPLLAADRYDLRLDADLTVFPCADFALVGWAVVAVLVVPVVLVVAVVAGGGIVPIGCLTQAVTPGTLGALRPE